MAALHDVAAVIHVHSTHSDGTGTVAEIAAAARQSFVDAVLLTDHDTLGAEHCGETGYHGPVLVVAGCEVSPRHGDHCLAFGLDEPIDHRGLLGPEIARRVAAAGARSFAAHPLADSRHFLLAPPMPWTDLERSPIDGIELWSFLADTGEQARSVLDIARFIADPLSVLTGPPARNLEAWDRICSRRRCVGFAGLDAHQIGVRVAGSVPLRLMAYRRSFRTLRTHLLLPESLTGDAEADAAALVEALGEGRAYLAVDGLAPAHGFRFWGRSPGRRIEMGSEARHLPGTVLRAEAPRECDLVLLRDGELVAEARRSRWIEASATEPGSYRVEAALVRGGRHRSWILSNPVYLR